MPANQSEAHTLLSLIFKGALVIVSPFCGWGILKFLYLIFTSPTYFFLLWLVALSIGLAVEFFTETWRPSVRLSRTAHPTGVTVTATVPENNSPTVLYKNLLSQEEVDDELENRNYMAPTAAPAKVIDDDADEDVKVPVRVISRSRSTSETGPRGKGYGKPVILRTEHKSEGAGLSLRRKKSKSKTRNKSKRRNMITNSQTSSQGSNNTTDGDSETFSTAQTQPPNPAVPTTDNEKEVTVTVRREAVRIQDSMEDDVNFNEESSKTFSLTENDSKHLYAGAQNEWEILGLLAKSHVKSKK